MDSPISQVFFHALKDAEQHIERIEDIHTKQALVEIWAALMEIEAKFKLQG